MRPKNYNKERARQRFVTQPMIWLQMHGWVTKKSTSANENRTQINSCPWSADINFFLLDKIQTKD